MPPSDLEEFSDGDGDGTHDLNAGGSDDSDDEDDENIDPLLRPIPAPSCGATLQDYKRVR